MKVWKCNHGSYRQITGDEVMGLAGCRLWFAFSWEKIEKKRDDTVILRGRVTEDYSDEWEEEEDD